MSRREDQKPIEQVLDFSNAVNPATIENNNTWFKDFKVLDFLRDVGKHLTVNYMLAKDSVKSRLESGISYTEFSYQLMQGYDFYWLNQHRGCTVQMGGSDQWGHSPRV
jgi:tyrosyl-tRNA synthetase